MGARSYAVVTGVCTAVGLAGPLLVLVYVAVGSDGLAAGVAAMLVGLVSGFVGVQAGRLARLHRGQVEDRRMEVER